MPIYGYECGQCGHHFEVLQSIAEARLQICPECGGELRKVFYPAGVIYKGSGFYSTDYKGSSSNGKSRDKSSSEGSGESKPGGESKPESKSEKKTDSKPAAE